MSVQITQASATDRPLIEQLLQDRGLPIAGLADHLKTTVVAREGDAVLGCAAVELYADGALLRSVAVARSAHGRRIGQQLTEAALALARAHHVPAVYLLTTTAESYFPKYGFAVTSREMVPAGVRQSVEFQSACPASATVMRKILNEVEERDA